MAEALVLDNFTLVDGTGGAPVPRAQVVVEGGVIVSVGTASTSIADASVVRFWWRAHRRRV
jgi:N-acyl-D-aspartate/D-glutamate deacylase